MKILEKIVSEKANGKKMFAVLIDPDKFTKEATIELCKVCEDAAVDFIFAGGSLLTENVFESCINLVKQVCHIPVVIFPGNTMQISNSADAIMFLSLISGRNPDMLIGKHVIAAPVLRKSTLEVIPTGYMVVDGGKLTSVTYMSNTMPIPYDKADIAACTAMAGEMLGLKLLFVDAGSGAQKPVSENMIKKVREVVNIPIIIGGGIKNAKDALQACRAGADLIVVGNAIEDDISIIKQLSDAVHSV